MDEQRLQDYLNLIQELLACSDGVELEILQRHPNLVDEGLVMVMEQVAAMMAEEGDPNADWLRGFALQLAEAIGEPAWKQLNQRVVRLGQEGQYGQAVIIAEQALALARKLWGEEHPHVATSLNNLAELYQSQGGLGEAEPLLEEALAMRKRLFSTDHTDVAHSLNNLAGLYHSQGRLDAAESLYKEALTMRKHLFPPDHCYIAKSLSNLGGLYHSQERLNVAAPLLEEALAMRKRLFPPDHCYIAKSLNNLGELYHSQGRLDAAKPLLEEALEMRKRLSPQDHRSVATSLSNLALLYQSQRRFDAAESFYQEALEMRKRLFLQDHPDVAHSLNNLGELYRSQGHFDAAEPMHQEALAMIKRLFPKGHPYVATSLNNLALLYQSQGRLDAAELLYKEGLAMGKRLFPIGHSNVARFLNNLATLLAATDRYSEALKLMKEATVIENRLISQGFAASSERARLVYLQKFRDHFDLFLSLVYKHLRHSPRAVQEALDLVLKRKALTAQAVAAQNQAIYSGRYPHLKTELEKLQELSDQIIHFTFTQPQPERIPQLQAEHDKFQEQLASQVPEIQLQEQPIDCRTVALELPEGSTLVEFVCFNVFDFLAASEESKWKPSRYLAFILTAGQPDDVQMIDLGEAEHINILIEVFRLYSSNRIQAVNSLDMTGDDENSENLRHPPVQIIQLRQAIFDPIRPFLSSHQNEASVSEAVRSVTSALLLAPDGDLNFVPFQILPSDETGEQLLMDEYRISYLSVGRDILRSQIQTKRPASQPLVIADPDFDLTDNRGIVTDSPFKRTSGTRFLGERVAKMLGVSPYLDREALASHLTKCKSPSILLIATHGYYSWEKQLQDYMNLVIALLICPEGQQVEILQKNRNLLDQELLEAIERSAFKLAEMGNQYATHRLRHAAQLAQMIKDSRSPALTPSYPGGEHTRFDCLSATKVEDPMLQSLLAFAGANAWLQGKTLPNEAGKGLVFAQDVAALDLWATELAVLSACNTAMGDIKIGEGVFGLRRAFAVAGAKTLVMSLWSVPDRATALLMEHFFTNLRQGLGRADALQDAQNYIRTITIKELQQSSLGLTVLEELKDLLPQDWNFCQYYRPLEHPYFWGAWVCQGDTTAISSSQIMK
ncbi:CHAT domain-containing protein [Microcoleus sp. ZQ-A2]|nr:CHAT domain-containing protein [Microcoleus sp. FACHB-1]